MGEFKMNFRLSAASSLGSHDAPENPLLSATYIGFSLRKRDVKKKESGLKALSDLKPSLLKLSRTLKLDTYPVLRKFEKDQDEVKEDSIKDLEGWTIDSHDEVGPDPYSDANEVWSGLLFTVKNDKDETDEFLLTTHGLGKWYIEEIKETKDLGLSEQTFAGWKVETATVHRDEKKGPYLKITIAEDHLLNIYPIDLNSSTNLKRFYTDFERTPSCMSIPRSLSAAS